MWASDKCTPLVREITFENAEELTEEGLPFLILFHAPDDTQSIKEYSDVVAQQLIEDKRKEFLLVLNSQNLSISHKFVISNEGWLVWCSFVRFELIRQRFAS